MNHQQSDDHKLDGPAFEPLRCCAFRLTIVLAGSSGIAWAASLATKLPFNMVRARLYAITITPNKYIPPPTERVTYMGIMRSKDSRKLYLSIPSG